MSRSTDATMAELIPDTKWRGALRRRLLHWFRKNARSLPWRRSPDVYQVWVSEIMLQQTQVSTVVPYYERFLRAFPTLADLAAAQEQQVLRLWEGLGYYRRARQLHQAARQVVQHHAGVFPRRIAEVQQLPGIGRYTAGAILSIAYDLPHPVLEANTMRLYSRLLGFRGDPTRNAGQRLLWQFAQSLLPRRNVGTMNQALMELGSEVCHPRQPDCSACPVRSLCRAASAGWQERIPRSFRRKSYQDVQEAAIVVWRRQQVLLRRCVGKQRWAGLWDFLRFPLDVPDETAALQHLVSETAKQTGLAIAPVTPLTTIKHGVTRFRITLRCYQTRCVSGRRHKTADLRWVSPSELDAYPLSATGRKIARLIQE